MRLTPAHVSRVRCILTWLMAVVAAFLQAGCSSDEPEVVLYVSADEQYARPIVRAFEEEHGIRVRFVGDAEIKKTTGLVQRLRAEKDRPRADVFWSSEIFHTINLAREGVLASHESDVTRDWPRAMRDDEGLWFGFAARARVIVYAPDRVEPDDVPKTWAQAGRSIFENRIVMADPRFGTTGGHLAAMRTYWTRHHGPLIYDGFLHKLAGNGIRLLPGGNAAVVQAVADGEADIGFTDTDDVYAAQRRGLNVAFVYPRHERRESIRGAGTLLIPNTVARVSGGPNPEHAALLIDFLLSTKTERMLAESASGNIPIGSELAEEYADRLPPDPLRFDWNEAAESMSKAINEAMAVLGAASSAS